MTVSLEIFLRRKGRHQALIKFAVEFNSGTSPLCRDTRWHYKSRFYGATNDRVAESIAQRFLYRWWKSRCARANDFSTLDELGERRAACRWILCLLPNESRFAGRHSSSTLRGRVLRKTQWGIFIATIGRQGSNLLTLIEHNTSTDWISREFRKFCPLPGNCEIFIVVLSRDDIACGFESRDVKSSH